MKEISFSEIKKRKRALEGDRQKLFLVSQTGLRASKRAIFACQRGDLNETNKLLSEAGSAVKAGKQLVSKHPALIGDGVWRSALEEYAEARLFHSYYSGDLQLPKELTEEPDALLGGLADLAGEIARFAVLKGTEHDKVAVERAHKTVMHIADTLAELDLTGSLRSKFDQTKQHLRKIEDIRYDLSQK